LTVSNFVAVSNQRKLWCTARILCFNKGCKKNVLFELARVRIPNLGVRYNSIGLLVFLRIRPRIHPKPTTPCYSDSAILVTSDCMLSHRSMVSAPTILLQ